MTIKPIIVHVVVFISILYSISMGGCKANGVEPLPTPVAENKWEEIALFKNADIMCMMQYNGTLYVSAVFRDRKFGDSVSVLYSSMDGEKWDTLKVFNDPIGPIAFHNDTLTILASGETWKYHASIGWVMFWEHYMLADQTYGMFWLNDELYIFSNRMDFSFTKDTVKRILISPSISKFVKHTYQGNDIYYTRPFYVYKDQMYRFNGTSLEIVMNGISSEENKDPNYPSIYVHDDTLFAGFNTPCRIKRLVNDVWQNVTDSIPDSKYSKQFSPNLTNRPTSITFFHNRMFIGTEWTGVLEWTGKKWIPITNGLQLEFPQKPEISLYRAIVQLECFKSSLFVAYGMPFYAPVVDGKGMVRYVLEGGK